MPKRRNLSEPRVVAHPRYGSEPHRSGIVRAESTIRGSHWKLDREIIYPESVLIADESRQNFCVYPRALYVDIRRECRTCARPFIFFAREQRYWYETLGFYVDADCVRCTDCRRASRNEQRRLRRYSDLRKRSHLGEGEFDNLLRDAIFLYEHGVLKNRNALGQLKNRALREIPHRSVTKVFAALLAASADDASAG